MFHSVFIRFKRGPTEKEKNTDTFSLIFSFVFYIQIKLQAKHNVVHLDNQYQFLVILFSLYALSKPKPFTSATTKCQKD